MLTNNKDVFMCIIWFHARAGYLQTYETLLKEIQSHPVLNPRPSLATSMIWTALH